MATRMTSIDFFSSVWWARVFRSSMPWAAIAIIMVGLCWAAIRYGAATTRQAEYQAATTAASAAADAVDKSASALVWQPSYRLTADPSGAVVLEDAEVLASGKHYFFRVPTTALPLRLGIVGRFSVVKPDAPKPNLGIHTGEVFLSGSGEGRYKFFPVDEIGARTDELPIFVTVIAVNDDGGIIYHAADLLPSEQEG